MLTTTDNPYNPWTQYDEWLEWDESHGYNTNNYLARLVNFDDDMDEEVQEKLINQALEEIIEVNVLGVYKIEPEPTSKV